MTDVECAPSRKVKQTRTSADWPDGDTNGVTRSYCCLALSKGRSIMNRDTQPKDLAKETSGTFEGWDICGTSYAPFPLDEPKFRRRARGTTLSSWLDSRDRCSASPAESVERPGSGSPVDIRLLEPMASVAIA